MNLNKVILSKEASECLKQLQGRTGLTPNILCRIGFCLSLAEPAVPNPSLYPEEDREFNRYTLLGEWDKMYVALLKQRLNSEGVPYEQIDDQFRAHLHRGVLALSRVAKSLVDVLRLSCRPSSTSSA